MALSWSLSKNILMRLSEFHFNGLLSGYMHVYLDTCWRFDFENIFSNFIVNLVFAPLQALKSIISGTAKMGWAWRHWPSVPFGARICFSRS